MQILDVIPFIPLPRNQPPVVSYFHSEAVERGKIVEVIFNNRKIKAVVAASAPLAERKLQFKKQVGFTLKKINKILKNKISEEQIKKAYELSEYYLVPLGIAMRAVFLHPEEKNYKKYLVSGPFLDLPDLEKIKNQISKIKIVDMRKEIRDANFSIFSRALKEALQTYDRIIIFIPRKGYANFLLCKDCGHAIKCPNCSVSLVLHQTLICHHCNFSMPIPTQCPNCKSHNLKAYGVGIDKVEAELKKFFQYQNMRMPDITLTTQSIFKERNSLHVPFLAIMNADALIHIPDYAAEENLLKQTLLLSSMAERTLIQTYNPDDPALVAVATGTVDEFWQRELALRKQYGYPPFTRLVLLTTRERKAEIAKRKAQDLAAKLGGIPYPALISRERGMYVWHVLLKISDPKKLSALRSQLYALPSDWHIDVDPISVV